MTRPYEYAVCLLVGALLPCDSGQGPAPEAHRVHRPSADERIAYYKRRLADDPELYPVLARLGEAYFERARRSHDPADLAEARDALRRSLAVQENHEGLRSMAALCNYSLGWHDSLDRRSLIG